jgi:hypothetical protein
MRADVDLLAKDDAGVKIVEKDGGPGVSLDQAFLDGGELFAPTEVVLDLSDQGIERIARGGAPVKPFDVEQLGSHRTSASSFLTFKTSTPVQFQRVSEDFRVMT